MIKARSAEHRGVIRQPTVVSLQISEHCLPLVPEAKIRGYNAGRFSFNVKSGRCDVCEGGGMRVIEMNFLPDVYVHCEKCNGKDTTGKHWRSGTKENPSAMYWI